MTHAFPLSRACAAEAVGTFALVFAGTGAVVVEAETALLVLQGGDVAWPVVGALLAVYRFVYGDRTRTPLFARAARSTVPARAPTP